MSLMKPQITILDKAAKYPPIQTQTGTKHHGYQPRPNKPKSIVVHTTNGKKNSPFENEVAFLLNTPNVSAAYIISKQGKIVQFLDPALYMEWHAGNVHDEAYANENSIGIELHYSPGEDTNQPAMMQALTNLVLYLCEEFGITLIDTHRAVAKPTGRKIDPSNLTDEQFYAWRDSILAPKEKMIPIIGHKNVSIDLLRDKLWRKNVNTQQIVPIVTAYTVYGELTGMGNIYPLAQSIHETGWFSSPRWLQSYNPAGLGADNSGSWGHVFNNAAEGILAQYAHLLVYATKPTDNSFVIEQICKLSPRYNAAVGKYGRGIAPNWVDLNNRWAVPGTTYGQKIIEIAEYLTK